jgi:hypothetical protein
MYTDGPTYTEWTNSVSSKVLFDFLYVLENCTTICVKVQWSSDFT